MFEPVSSNVSFPDLDAKLLEQWDQKRIFELAVDNNRDREPFVFYEGPPTANGMPHPGHVLTRVMKDVFLRYKSMAGFYVPRRAGWDTHGLPVEVEVEKDLGITGRHAIEEYGVEAFSKKCIESVFRYIEEWRRMTREIGFWIDLEDAYVTFHQSYVESVWWALSELFKKGLLFQDYKVVWWWPQGGTALSSGEVGQGYRTIDDPSVVVRFPIVGRNRTSLLAWTTTPWTLPSNIALAVAPEIDYATVALADGEQLIVADALRTQVLGDEAHTVVAMQKGRDLCGLEYEPPFRYAEPAGGPAFVVVAAEFVTLDAGTGLVHMAPAFGEDDFRVVKQEKLGFLQLVQADGTFPPEVSEFAGRFCKEADRDIIRNLRARGLLFKEEIYRHEYPFCWRKDTDPLIQYARRSWFIRTTQEIERVIENNANIHWEPEHIKEGRMGAFLRSNVDWALSRERFWGTPLPIWVNDQTGNMEAIASAAELESLNPAAFAHFEAAKEKDPSLSDDLKVHKPWIDEVTFEEPGEPGVYRRVPEVIDCWFDSGCMPFAQWGYPQHGPEEFKRCFPADFITEAVDQTRGWFYSLMTISTLLFGDRNPPHPFRNCVVLGLICDEKGIKLSKSKRNYTDPLDMIHQHGADAVRWALYTGTVPGQNTRFFEGAIVEALRDFLLKIWNVYSFLVTYANIDGWTPDEGRPQFSERPDMDRWILAELDATVREVRGHLDAFRSHLASRRLQSFVDALSNWYVRRSRERFWVEGDSPDKSSAFTTLYEVLLETATLAAPFVPFVAEAVYRNLAGDAGKPSVHLAEYPVPADVRRDEDLRIAMDAARTVVSLGQRVRAEQKIKVRQPLGEAIVVVTSDEDRARIDRFGEAIREELNVKNIAFTTEPAKYVEFELLPNFRALGPRLGKKMPAVKKALGQANGAALYAEMEKRGRIVIDLDGDPLELSAEDVQVRLKAKEDFAAASQGGRVVVIDTRVTEELRQEGLVREAINRIQRARKDDDLPFEARIELGCFADGYLLDALTKYQTHIETQTLATMRLVSESSLANLSDDSGEFRWGPTRETAVDDHPLKFRMRRREK